MLLAGAWPRRWADAAIAEGKRLIERHFGYAGCHGVDSRIVSRRAAYVSNPPGVKKIGGCLFFQPAQALAPVRTPVSEKVYESTVNCALLFPFTVTLRRFHDACINQRIDSLPCPALFLNVSGAASPLSTRARISPNCNDRPAQARTTVGLCGRVRQWPRGQSGM